MKLSYLIAALGFAAVVLAAMASDAGTDLPYTVPAALLGVGLMWYGIGRANSIRRTERWKEQRIHSNRDAYRLGFRRAQK